MGCVTRIKNGPFWRKKSEEDPVERDIARGLPHVNLQAETEALTFINRHSHKTM